MQQRVTYSGQTTAIMTKSPNSRYDSNSQNNAGISPNFLSGQTGTFNPPQPFHTVLTPNSIDNQNYNSGGN